MDIRPKPRCQSKDACITRHTYCWISIAHKYIYFETPKCGSSTLKNILPDKKIIGHVDPYTLGKFFKFSFVRNPWSRMVSLYYNFFVEEKAVPKVAANRYRILLDLFGKDKMSFREFIESFPNCSNHHWEQSYVFFEGIDMDFIGKFENFSEDVGKVYSKLGFEPPVIPHINKTKHKPYTEYYEPDLVDIVAKEFAGDIERFGYVFDISQG